MTKMPNEIAKLTNLVTALQIGTERPCEGYYVYDRHLNLNLLIDYFNAMELCAKNETIQLTTNCAIIDPATIRSYAGFNDATNRWVFIKDILGDKNGKPAYVVDIDPETKVVMLFPIESRDSRKASMVSEHMDGDKLKDLYKTTMNTD